MASNGIDLADTVDDIHAVQQLDAENYEVVRGAIGDGLDLFSQLMSAFDFLRNSLLSPVKPMEERVLTTGIYFVLWCRYHCTQAVLTLMRGHRNDAFAHLRRGVEGAAFAARIKRHPHLADVWMEARDSKEAFDSYKEKFGTSRIFPEDDPALFKLFEVYETTNSFSHPSLKGLAGHVETVSTDDDGFEVKFKYHQFEPGDPSEFLRTYLYVVRANRWALEVFGRVFDEAVRSRSGPWQLRLNSFDASWSVNAQKWKHLVLGGDEVVDPVEAGVRQMLRDESDA